MHKILLVVAEGVIETLKPEICANVEDEIEAVSVFVV
jgi:hypothetical protein